MAFDEQDTLHAIRPIWILVHNRMTCGSLMVADVHPYFLARRDTDLLVEQAHLSSAKMCIDVSSFPPDLFGDKHATSNKRQKNEISNSETLRHRNEANLAEFVYLHLFYGRTIGYTLNSAIGMDKKTVVYYFRIFDPGKNGLQSTDDLSMKLRYEFVLGSKKQSSSYYNPRRRQREICRYIYLHEIDP